MYELTKSEINKLNDYWKFIETFIKPLNHEARFGGTHTQTYRIRLIHDIREKYSINEFYNYEKILNKLLYNLLEHVGFSLEKYEIEEIHKLFVTIKNPTTNSYSHKKYLHDEKKNIKYDFEHYKSLTDITKVLKIFTTLSSKHLYEKVMNNKNELSKIKYVKYYYPMDYPFPNVNLLFYNQNKKDTWISRINKLYYTNTNNKLDDKEWYNFIL
jgi:hypothetical protein